jgi:hypothetical protein
MAWTAPRTWVVSEIVTAALLNAQIRDNELDLDARTTMVQSPVTTSQTTTSTTYTDLATAGPAVTLTVGTQMLVTVGCQLTNNTAADGALMSFAMTGAATVAAGDDRAFGVGGFSGSLPNLIGSRTWLVTGLTPGSYTVKAVYKAVTGGTATFLNRQIIAQPGNKLA